MSEFEEIQRKKFPYKITKFNWIFYIIAIILASLLRLLTFENFPEFIGNCIGLSIGFLIFASLFGVIFWFILGRKENGGSYTFNVLILLMLFGQLGEFSRTINSRKENKVDIRQAIQKYKDDIKNDSLQGNEALDSFAVSLEKGIDELIDDSRGNEKKLYISLKAFLNESIDEANLWNDAYYKINDDAFFNFNVLKNEGEFESQIEIAQDYIKASNRYKVFFQQRMNRLNAIIENNGINDEFANKMTSALRKKIKKQGIVFIPYIDNHIKYGEKMVEILKFTKDKKWKSSDLNFVEFSNSKYQEEFDSKINQLVVIEENVNELHSKLIDVM